MVETLSLDDWLRHPLSRVVPQEVGYVVKFRGADPSGRFTRHWIDQLSEERANMIATFFGWRIRKGKRGDDLVARKTALNHVDALIAKHGEATAETLLPPGRRPGAAPGRGRDYRRAVCEEGTAGRNAGPVGQAIARPFRRDGRRGRLDWAGERRLARRHSDQQGRRRPGSPLRDCHCPVRV